MKFTQPRHSRQRTSPQRPRPSRRIAQELTFTAGQWFATFKPPRPARRVPTHTTLEIRRAAIDDRGAGSILRRVRREHHIGQR